MFPSICADKEVGKILSTISIKVSLNDKLSSIKLYSAHHFLDGQQTELDSSTTLLIFEALLQFYCGKV